MSFDVRRFQFLLGTDCECSNLTYVDEAGSHVAVVSCCPRCWEIGMMRLSAQSALQHDEVELRQLEFEMDGVVEPSSPPAA